MDVQDSPQLMYFFPDKIIFYFVLSLHLDMANNNVNVYD
jgi:hypothetical protein